MTAPLPTGPDGEPLPPQQGLTPAEQAALAALAAYTAGTAAVSAAAVLAALLALGIPRTVGRAVLQLALLAGRTTAPAPTGPGRDAARAVARREPLYRAAYLLNAGKRLTRAVLAPPRVRPAPATLPTPTAPGPDGVPGPPATPAPAGPVPGDIPGDAVPGDTGETRRRRDALAAALEAERRYLDQHRRAAQRRAELAAQLDQAAARHGRYLLWRAVLDDRTTPDCALAHGRAFDAYAPPAMGIPGAVHAHCRCHVGGRARPGHPMIGGGTVPGGPPRLRSLAHTVDLARYVRTPAGVRRYKKPIGALITTKGGGRRSSDGSRTGSGRTSRKLPEREIIARALERKRQRRGKAQLAANRLGNLDRATAARQLGKLTQPQLYAIRTAARDSLASADALGPGRGTRNIQHQARAAIAHADRELARRVNARIKGMDDATLEQSMNRALQRNRLTEFDRYAAEIDRRDRERQRGTQRREAERQRRAAAEEAKAAQYERLLAQGYSDEDAVADAYGVSPRRQREIAALARLRADGYAGAGLRDAAREAYRAELRARYDAAEDATHGYLLTNAAEARGIDPRTLFSMPEARARKLASDELKQHWDEVGRLSFDEFLDQLLDDPAAALRRRSARSDYLA